MKLRSRVVSLFVFQVVFLAMFMLLYWQPSYVDHLTNRAMSNERGVLKIIAPAIVEPLLKGELSHIYEMLDEQKSLRNTWSFITLKNAEGMMLYPLPGQLAQKSLGEDYRRLRQPVESLGEHLGELTVDVDLRAIIKQEYLQVNYLLFLILAVLVVSALILIYFLDSGIARPLRALSVAAEKMKDGIYSPSLIEEKKRDDEVGDLIKAFAGMGQSIEFSQQALKGHAMRLKAVLDTVGDGIVMINSRGIIESVNSSVMTMFGYSEDELLGSNVSMLMEPEQARMHGIYIARHVSSGKPVLLGKNRLLNALRKSGDVFPVELNVSEIVQGDAKKFVGTVRDITDKVKIDRLKNEFVSTVSHELRTPITSIKGSLDLVAAGVVGDVNEQMQSLLDIAKSNSSRLLLLINDILDIDKIESGNMDFSVTQCSVNQALAAAVKNNQAYAAQFDVQLRMDMPDQDAVFEVDLDRFLQVMSNLISNACKFSERSNEVVVGALRAGRQIQFYVEDHGAGIAEEFRARVFSKFAQADGSDTRKVSGSGLGLSISKALVENMAGKIWYESELGRGTTFFCEFPLARQVNLEIQQR